MVLSEQVPSESRSGPGDLGRDPQWLSTSEVKTWAPEETFFPLPSFLVMVLFLTLTLNM